MLHIIFGRSGSGKTRFALETARNAAESGGAVLIVPEQFTFETERAVVRKFGARACLGIEVLSFSRLVHSVMSRYGGLACRYVDDCGRNVLMRLALNRIGDMLKVYSKQAKSSSFVKTMVGAVAEYKVCGISPDMLLEAAKKTGGGLLRYKLNDIALIMETYCALMENKFSDSLDDLSRLAEKLDEHPFFKGKTVIFDGFKGFTVQERNVIGRILRGADNVYVTLCAEGMGGAQERGLFSPAEKTARQLVAIAGKYGCPVASPEKLHGSGRFAARSLEYLEKSVFRPGAKPFSEPAPEIHIVSAANIYEEAKFAACEIMKLVRNKKCRFGEITVISRGLELYDGIIDPVFDKYGIPYFYDLRQGIASHPLMALVQSLLCVITTGYRQEYILRYLKTGLAGFSLEEVSALENYLLMWDIKGEEMWSGEWTGNPKGFGAESTDETACELEKLNVLRERIYIQVSQLRKKMESGSKVKVLYDFLCSIGVDRAAGEACRKLESSGETRLAGEYAAIWGKFVAMLDQIDMASLGEPLSLSEFADVVSLTIENTDLGSIPPTLDAVTIGDAERIRTQGAGYVFVIGLAEGIFPRKAAPSGVISDSERRRLINLGIELSPPAEEQALDERFYAYKAMTAASNAIYLTYPRADASGRALRPSYFLPAVKKILPGCDIRDDALRDPIDMITNKKTAFDLLAQNYGGATPLFSSLKEVFAAIPEYKSRAAAVETAAAGRRLEFSNPITAKKLYGETMRVSPSSVETFGQCRFLYFCRYGIRAAPRKRAELAAPEIGTVIHFVLERLLSQTMEQGLEEIPEDTLRRMTEKLLKEFADVYLGGLDNKTERFRFLFGRLSETVVRLVEHMAEEFAQSGFKPVDFELLISPESGVKPYEIKISDGGRLLVGGKVDRVDIMKLGGKTYLRVVDYKTGVKNFNLSDLLYGLNLQMFIYLFTLCENSGERYGKDVVPAGVLYVPAKKPSLTALRSEPEGSVKKRADKQLRMNGMVLGDADVIIGMERNGGGRFIPAQLKPEEDEGGKVRYSINARSSAATLEQFGILKRHIEEMLKSMALTLREGDARAIPVSGLNYNPCEYCDYKSVCGFEPGCKVKNIFKLENKEIFNKMEEESADGTQMD